MGKGQIMNRSGKINRRSRSQIPLNKFVPYSDTGDGEGVVKNLHKTCPHGKMGKRSFYRVILHSFFEYNKLFFFLICLIIFAFHMRDAHAKGITINRIWTSDANGSEKDWFTHGDKININEKISPNGNKSVSASGEIIGVKKSTNGKRGKKWLVKLKKQDLGGNEQTTINWTETIPTNAKLNSKARVAWGPVAWRWLGVAWGQTLKIEYKIWPVSFF